MDVGIGRGPNPNEQLSPATNLPQISLASWLLWVRNALRSWSSSSYLFGLSWCSLLHRADERGESLFLPSNLKEVQAASVVATGTHATYHLGSPGRATSPRRISSRPSVPETLFCNMRVQSATFRREVKSIAQDGTFAGLILSFAVMWQRRKIGSPPRKACLGPGERDC